MLADQTIKPYPQKRLFLSRDCETIWHTDETAGSLAKGLCMPFQGNAQKSRGQDFYTNFEECFRCTRLVSMHSLCIFTLNSNIWFISHVLGCETTIVTSKPPYYAQAFDRGIVSISVFAVKSRPWHPRAALRAGHSFSPAPIAKFRHD